ncbi:MAG: hypothetical protein NXI32_23920 [bacterium]|nr:hypothetical protein [bacterium]
MTVAPPEEAADLRRNRLALCLCISHCDKQRVQPNQPAYGKARTEGAKRTAAWQSETP